LLQDKVLTGRGDKGKAATATWRPLFALWCLVKDWSDDQVGRPFYTQSGALNIRGGAQKKQVTPSCCRRTGEYISFLLLSYFFCSWATSFQVESAYMHSPVISYCHLLAKLHSLQEHRWSHCAWRIGELANSGRSSSAWRDIHEACCSFNQHWLHLPLCYSAYRFEVAFRYEQLHSASQNSLSYSEVPGLQFRRRNQL
jgi:hypothetical protein